MQLVIVCCNSCGPQNKKAHKNGIKKPQNNRYSSMKGVSGEPRDRLGGTRRIAGTAFHSCAKPRDLTLLSMLQAKVMDGDWCLSQP